MSGIYTCAQPTVAWQSLLDLLAKHDLAQSQLVPSRCKEDPKSLSLRLRTFQVVPLSPQAGRGQCADATVGDVPAMMGIQMSLDVYRMINLTHKTGDRSQLWHMICQKKEMPAVWNRLGPIQLKPSQIFTPVLTWEVQRFQWATACQESWSGFKRLKLWERSWWVPATQMVLTRGGMGCKGCPGSPVLVC